MLKNIDKIDCEEDLSNFAKTNRSEESEYFIMRNMSPDNLNRPNFGGYKSKKYTETVKGYLEGDDNSPTLNDKTVSDSDTKSMFRKDSKLRIISK